MNAFVVDVNVPMVANNAASQADQACVSACVEALIDIKPRSVIGASICNDRH